MHFCSTRLNPWFMLVGWSHQHPLQNHTAVATQFRARFFFCFLKAKPSRRRIRSPLVCCWESGSSPQCSSGWAELGRSWRPSDVELFSPSWPISCAASCMNALSRVVVTWSAPTSQWVQFFSFCRLTSPKFWGNLVSGTMCSWEDCNVEGRLNSSAGILRFLLSRWDGSLSR